VRPVGSSAPIHLSELIFPPSLRSCQFSCVLVFSAGRCSYRSTLGRQSCPVVLQWFIRLCFTRSRSKSWRRVLFLAADLSVVWLVVVFFPTPPPFGPAARHVITCFCCLVKGSIFVWICVRIAAGTCHGYILESLVQKTRGFVIQIALPR
jgi:hypothetical protein